MRGCLALLILMVAGRAGALPQDRGFFQFVRDAWGLEEGIPQVTVRAIAQDHDGYVWVATEAGLARLDGIRFQPYLREHYPALGTNSMRALHVDRSGRLWVGTGLGAVYLDRGAFHPAQSPAGGLGPVNAILEDADGNLYIAGRHLFRRRADAQEFHPIAGIDDAVQSLTLHQGHLWAATSDRLFRIEQGAAVPVSFAAGDPLPAINRILSLGPDRILLTTAQGLFVWQSGMVKQLPLRDPEHPTKRLDSHGYTDALLDRNGTIWTGSHEALLRLDLHGRLIDIVYSGSSEAITNPISFFEDREDNLWIGSRHQGVMRLWPGRAQIFGTADGLGERIVWSLLANPDGSLLVGAYRGIFRFDGRRFESWMEPEKLASGDAYSMLRSIDGNVWVGGEHGLTRIAPDLSTEKFGEFSKLKIFNILDEPDGSIWLATSQGLFLGRGESFQRMGDEAGIDGMVSGLKHDRQGTLWVGTPKGLFLFRDGEFVRHPDASLATVFVTSVNETNDGELLVATYEDGIFVLDANGRSYPIRDRIALASPVFTGAFKSGDGHLWATTLQGVVRLPFDQASALAPQINEHFVVSDLGDRPGSQRARCCNGLSNSHRLVTDDSLFVATNEGLLKIPLDQAVSNPVPPLVHVESIRSATRAYTLGAALQLARDERDLEISYTALSFQDPRNIRFRYRLLGLSDRWVEAGQRRTAYFTNLAGGSYRFQVLAANSAGTWSTAPAEATLSIALRWHERAGVIALLVAAAIAALATAFWWAIRHQRQRRHALEHVVATRTVELQDANDQLQQLNRDLVEASSTDPLTGLRNRRYFSQEVTRDLAALFRIAPNQSRRRYLCFMLVDIDHFKRINDRFGHDAGDRVIRFVAGIVQRCSRECDTAVRWGGEEFLLVQRNVSFDDAQSLADRLCCALREAPFVLSEERSLSITASLGFICVSPEMLDPDSPSWEQAVDLADQAMYAVKRQGRNGWSGVRPAEAGVTSHILRDAPNLQDLLSTGALVQGECVVGLATEMA